MTVFNYSKGSRFQYSMMGSAVWSGKLGLDEARSLVGSDGTSVGEELDRLGWVGTRRTERSSYAATFELHIEQGPILEAEAVDVGVVTGVQGFRWYTIDLIGKPAHAGPTPMAGRADPARAIAGVEFDRACVDAVQASVDALGFSNKKMVSGAGHDACYVASRYPTSMIFVPCEGGLSHNEAERITPEQAERGSSVLLGAVQRMVSR